MIRECKNTRVSPLYLENWNQYIASVTLPDRQQFVLDHLADADRLDDLKKGACRENINCQQKPN